mmetsp:Transcript_8836/g.15620  ORF Transcript_8836/g.15620 Transcript_8836/m.15620 type:complete len:127 (+) Transcript_8836:254-634(+)
MRVTTPSLPFNLLDAPKSPGSSSALSWISNLQQGSENMLRKWLLSARSNLMQSTPAASRWRQVAPSLEVPITATTSTLLSSLPPERSLAFCLRERWRWAAPKRIPHINASRDESGGMPLLMYTLAV